MDCSVYRIGLPLAYRSRWSTFLKLIKNWWNPYPETQHSTIQTGYLRFSYFLVICTMLAKALVVILTFRYFNNDETIKKSVTLFTLSFKLDGRSANNPITQALSGNSRQNFSGVEQGNLGGWWKFNVYVFDDTLFLFIHFIYLKIDQIR